MKEFYHKNHIRYDQSQSERAFHSQKCGINDQRTCSPGNTEPFEFHEYHHKRIPKSTLKKMSETVKVLHSKSIFLSSDLIKQIKNEFVI